MKQLFFILLISIAFLTKANPLLDSAKTAYDNGNYSKAINFYKNIEQQGYVSDALFYNLGNSYFRKNEIGKAILNYEKALLVNNSHEDALYNIAIAQAKTIDKLDDIPEVSFSRFLIGFDRIIPSTFVVIIGLILILSTSILLILKKKDLINIKSNKAFIGLLVIGLLMNLIGIKQNNAVNNFKEAVILVYKTDILNEPSENSKMLFQLHEGTKVEIKSSTEDGWFEIKTKSGEIGWISNDKIGVIEL